MSALRFFLSKHPLTSALFVGALGLAVFFAVRMATQFVYFHDPAHQNQALEAWMRPHYVAMSYHIPPRALAEALEIDPDQHGGRKGLTMGNIAEMKGVDLETLTGIVAEAASEFREKDK